MCKISVIVPVYQVEEYIEECINSILKQSFIDFELILVDDGSPDNCPDICDNYARLDDRVKVIHKENGGLSEARNFGIDIAKGDYITFIDSDDWINGKYLHELIYAIEQTKADIACINHILYIAEGTITNSCDDNTLHIYDCIGMLNEQYYQNSIINSGTATGKLFRRELFKQVRFPVGRIHEDDFTTYKLYYSSKKIVLYKKGLYLYRIRDNSIMRNLNIKSQMDIIVSMEEKLNYIRDIKVFTKFYRLTCNNLVGHLKTAYSMVFDSNNDKQIVDLKIISKNNFPILIKYTNLYYKIILIGLCFSPKLIYKLQSAIDKVKASKF